MFRFRLQSVLDVKVLQEEMAQTDFSRQQRLLEREREALQAIRRQKDDLIDALRGVRGRRVSAPELALGAADVEQCLRCEAIQEGRVQEAEAEANRRREALLTAAQNRKAMETLKTKGQERHHLQAGLRENAAIDEMAIVGHQRRKGD